MAHKNLTKQDVVGWLRYNIHGLLADRLQSTPVEEIKNEARLYENSMIRGLPSEKSS